MLKFSTFLCIYKSFDTEAGDVQLQALSTNNLHISVLSTSAGVLGIENLNWCVKWLYLKHDIFWADYPLACKAKLIDLLNGSRIVKQLASLFLCDNQAKILQCGAEVRLPATLFVHYPLTPARAPNSDSTNSKCPLPQGCGAVSFCQSVSEWTSGCIMKSCPSTGQQELWFTHGVQFLQTCVCFTVSACASTPESLITKTLH